MIKDKTDHQKCVNNCFGIINDCAIVVSETCEFHKFKATYFDVYSNCSMTYVTHSLNDHNAVIF